MSGVARRFARLLPAEPLSRNAEPADAVEELNRVLALLANGGNE